MEEVWKDCFSVSGCSNASLMCCVSARSTHYSKNEAVGDYLIDVIVTVWQKPTSEHRRVPSVWNIHSSSRNQDLWVRRSESQINDIKSECFMYSFLSSTATELATQSQSPLLWVRSHRAVASALTGIWKGFSHFSLFILGILKWPLGGLLIILWYVQIGWKPSHPSHWVSSPPEVMLFAEQTEGFMLWIIFPVIMF